MKILMINVVCGIRSTGRICTDLATALEAQGHEVKIAYGREEVPEKFQKYAVKIGTDLDVKLHGLRARLFDGCGWGSKKATEKFIAWVKEWNPDVIHLHNIHGYYINIEILFDYLRTSGKKIIWTLHDCWPFTGHAAYCDYVECERWIDGCNECPNKKEYPVSLIDRSKSNWNNKKRLFEDLDNLTIVTPSEWLAGLVRSSFLSDYPVVVIHNGVDTDIFKPLLNAPRSKCSDKKIVLGVAALWEKRKGLEDFVKLADILPDTYQIVLIGLSAKQKQQLPRTIIGIGKTNSAYELAEFYNLAEVYVNPTYEDNYPTTNLESIACGTPVITYDTGGSKESAKIYGCVVEKGDIVELKNCICNIRTIVRDFKDNRDNIGIQNTVGRYLRLY